MPASDPKLNSGVSTGASKGALPDAGNRSRSNVRDRPRRVQIRRSKTPRSVRWSLGSVRRACGQPRCPLVAETLAQRGDNALVPGDRALFEAEVVAAGFRLDFAEALGVSNVLTVPKYFMVSSFVDRTPQLAPTG